MLTISYLSVSLTNLKSNFNFVKIMNNILINRKIEATIGEYFDGQSENDYKDNGLYNFRNFRLDE